MPSRSTATAPLALAVTLALAAPAAAQGYRGVEPYGPAISGGYGYGAGGYGDYGYAGEFVRGTYVGAPLTRVPSPRDIVPTPWSYGTYGIPTVSGIPPAPVARPTITRIEADGPAARGARPARWVEPDPAGVRVVEVRVPRR